MKKIIKKLFWFGLFIVILLGITSYIVTQPIIRHTMAVSNIEKADAERLTYIVRHLSEVLPRTTGSENQNASRDFIQLELEKTNAIVRLQEYQARDKSFFNVIARFEGSQNCPLKIIGAHYDAFGGHPGADDNASGVAALIEIARILNSLESIQCSIELVAYANEEPPYFRSEEMGSYIHAKSLFDSGIDVGMMISLETMGYFSDEPGSQYFPVGFLKYLYSDVGNYIALVGDLNQITQTRFIKASMQNVMSTDVYSVNAPRLLQGIDFSDHLNYWKFDYPGVMLTDTAFNRNLAYHTPEDTWDRLDYQRMADVVNGVVNSVRR